MTSLTREPSGFTPLVAAPTGAVSKARRLALENGLAAAIALAGAAVIVFAAYRTRNAWVGDAAVYLPYARHAADGHFFQFNLGEFSSGSTSPLWAVLLGIPYLFGFGLMGAKAFSAGFALVGFAATLLAARRLAGSWLAAAAASLLVLGTMTLFAISLYESGLVVALGALSLIAGDRALAMWRAQETVSASSLAPLVAVWAALPLARPDSIILVGAEAAALFLCAPVSRRRAALTLLIALAVAAIPAAAYFGYSQIELGTFSTSSQGRSEALREGSDKWIGPLYRSSAAARELFASPWVFALLPALAGFALMARRRPTRWLAIYGGLTIAGYLVLLSFVTPSFYDTARYLVPLVPIVAVGAAWLLAQARGSWLWPVALAGGVAAIGIASVQELRDYTNLARSLGITEHEVFERDVGATINRMARPGDQVLSYEVQMRYSVRDDVDVLSEDGITDGKVAPYQRSRDMTGFLLRYKPRWWIADRNVRVRRYMRGSVLERAAARLKADPTRHSVTLDGIRFEPVARRHRPLALGFGGWELLVELKYPASSG